MAEPRGPQFDSQVTPAENPEQDAELLRRFEEWEKILQGRWSAWVEQAKQAYDFTAGHQWEPADRSKMEENGKIPVVFNITAPTLDAVQGAEIQNRQQVQYYAREPGDQGVSDALTQAAEFISDECNGDQEDSEAFYDCLTCGVGWTNSAPTLDVDQIAIVKERVDPLQVMADGRKPNFEDGRYLRWARPMSRDDFEDYCDDLGRPDANPDDAGMNARGGKRLTVVNPQLRYTNGLIGDGSSDDIEVCEWQWWEKEPMFLAPLPSPDDQNVVKVGKLSPDDFASALQDNPSLPHARTTEKVYYRAVVANGEILFKETLPEKCFRLQAITGKRDRNNGTWFGLVRAMIDPQKFTNKLYSEILHIVRTNANGGLTMEEDAVADIRKFEQTYAQADKITWVKPGALSNAQGPKMAPKSPTPINPALFQMMEFARDMVKACTGVNEEILGMAGREQPGVLEAQRKQAAYGILSAFFDAKRRYQRNQGKLQLAQIREFIPNDKLVRIVDKGTATYVPIAMTLESQEYDIVVDEAPAGPNQKAKVMATLGPMIPEMFQSGIIGAEEIADMLQYMDIPAAVADKLAAAIRKRAQAQQQPNPTQQAMEQLTQQGAAAKVENVQADTQSKIAKANKDNANAQTEGVRAQADLVAAQHKPETEMIKAKGAAMGSVLKAMHPPAAPAPKPLPTTIPGPLGGVGGLTAEDAQGPTEGDVDQAGGGDV